MVHAVNEHILELPDGREGERAEKEGVRQVLERHKRVGQSRSNQAGASVVAWMFARHRDLERDTAD